MRFEDIIVIPIYVFIALIIIKALRLDAWIDWFLKLFREPNHLETRVPELEKKVKELESQIAS